MMLMLKVNIPLHEECDLCNLVIERQKIRRHEFFQHIIAHGLKYTSGVGLEIQLQTKYFRLYLSL